MIYLDSPALLKLVVREAETDALCAWLGDHTDPVCSSALAKVEVTLATRRVAPEHLPRPEPRSPGSTYCRCPPPPSPSPPRPSNNRAASTHFTSHPHCCSVTS